MTDEALIGVMPRAQSVGICSNLGKHRIQFAGNRRTIRYVGAVVAGGFEADWDIAGISYMERKATASLL